MSNGHPIPNDVVREATGTTVVNSINAGRFLVIANHHGATNLWQYPGFDTAFIPAGESAFLSRALEPRL